MHSLTFLYQDQIIVLRSPSNNNYQIPINVTTKLMMDGTRYAYTSTTNVVRQSIPIVELDRAMIYNLFNFIKNTIGKELIFIDHNEDEWFGKILNDPAEITQAAKNKNTLTLIFEGKLNG